MVFVADKNSKLFMSIIERRARILLKKRRAIVLFVCPFFIQIWVKAIVTKGKKTGIYTGQVAMRKIGKFKITTKDGVIKGINYKFCKLIEHGDGYRYTIKSRPTVNLNKKSLTKKKQESAFFLF